MHEKIGEFNYNIESKNWTLVKVRTDKCANAKGNSIKMARNILSNILYNITFDMMCTGLSNCYFEFKRSNEYSAMTAFINKVK